MIINLEFKNAVVQSEFMDPDITDPRLYGLICALGNWAFYRLKKRVVVTDVARYDGPLASPHRIGPDNPRSRAADIRAHNGYWKPVELNAIKLWLRDWFPRPDMIALEASIPGWQGTLRHHGDGPNEHLHIAVAELPAVRKAMGLVDAV